MDLKAYNIIMKWVEHAEGGYVDNPDDPGGATNFGISQKSFPHIDIKTLTIDDAMIIYKNQYWTPLQLDKYPFSIGLFIFDTSILQGISIATKLIRIHLKNVNDINQSIMQLLPLRLWELALDRDFAKFGEGWTNRIADLINRINIIGGDDK